jgi:hypothetical protein
MRFGIKSETALATAWVVVMKYWRPKGTLWCASKGKCSIGYHASIHRRQECLPFFNTTKKTPQELFRYLTSHSIPTQWDGILLHIASDARITMPADSRNILHGYICPSSIPDADYRTLMIADHRSSSPGSPQSKKGNPLYTTSALCVRLHVSVLLY